MIASALVPSLWIAQALGGGPAPQATNSSGLPQGSQAPQIEVGTSGQGLFERGDELRVFFRTLADGYITILHVSTDGRIRFLFPHQPWRDNFALGGREYEVPDPSERAGGPALRIDDYPGQGYVFAVISSRPFDYRHYIENDEWDYRLVAYDGRIAGDPYSALREVVDRMIPVGQLEYWVDLVSYTVVGARDAYPVWVAYMNWCATTQFVREEPYEGGPFFWIERGVPTYPVPVYLPTVSAAAPAFAVPPRRAAGPYQPRRPSRLNTPRSKPTRSAEPRPTTHRSRFSRAIH